MKKLLYLPLFLISQVIMAQSLSKSDLEAMTSDHWQHGLDLLREIVSIPNDAAYKEQITENLIWCKDQFGGRGFSLTELETGGLPLLLAERKAENGEKTILFYFHVDGQAVEKSKWNQEDPFIPVLKEKTSSGEWTEIQMERANTEYDPDWRIFARSSSDDKGPIAMFLTAWDALSENNLSPDFNVKIILDFEEEQGSPLLPEAVKTHRDKLMADMMIIMDGPRHISNEPTLTFGARGISTMTLTTYGPVVPQHSGHFGNYAPNPAFMLAQLLASMKNENGRVSIPGFYDGIEISDEERAVLAAVPDDEDGIRDRLQISRIDDVGSYYQESIQYPSLNIRGMNSAWVGKESRTIVPSTAVAEIDVRLVKESDPNRLFKLIEDHIQNQGFTILDHDPIKEERMKFEKVIKLEKNIAYQAFRTPIDSEAGAWLRGMMERAFGKAPVQIRTSGGSVPISPFVDALDIPAVTVPTVNADNNQHSPNENIRLGNYRDGIRTALSILTQSYK
ncbi:M20/M25/M40 family metallo-hydrolase [Algoriphagus sediminis]|uniref:M20/M25/M40 family metallo-hydrolase n=1 Tax=Algoriphagus sediminis TaxID=3057113 RepID=A0ABT7Y888_9BACT|nr:M20/M25/M40 family metallo-hydrolase [Algoriphagus sediminis]MDN3202690.1 M20/M25/M40 family metallo-hydrolase [Algoriphagus sediminis]